MGGGGWGETKWVEERGKNRTFPGSEFATRVHIPHEAGIVDVICVKDCNSTKI